MDTPVQTPLWFWFAFIAFILALLLLDLGVFRKKSRVISVKEALSWCGVWVSLALLFNLVVYFWHGPVAGLEFFTGYLLEYSLSVDNIFVFLLVFSYFKVPDEFQHRVLFWGILGALILRALLILFGIALIERFHWVLYIFGAILIISGLRMAGGAGEEMDPGKNPILRFLRKIMPVTKDYVGNLFFVKREGLLLATPLFVVLIFLELTDLVFALDSIPAIIGITRNSFVVFTSNVFAILGLRSLYFALAGLMGMFRYLSYGLAAVLTFVGTKMVVEHWIPVSVGASLTVIITLLFVSVVASLLNPEKKDEGKQEKPPDKG